MRPKSKSVKSRFHQGKIGENLALKFLRQKGFRLILKNYHVRGGELDLILTKDDILVFVEVKTRWSTSFGSAEEALPPRKKRSLLKTIYAYLRQQKKYSKWRCDLVVIQFTERDSAYVKHLTDIFME